MKLLKNLLAVAAVIATVIGCAAPAQAQFDLFAAPRTFIVTPPTTSAVTFSNAAAVDIRGCEGIAKLDFSCVTNASATTVTATVYDSPDLTNWTAVANYALATSAAVISTNTYYGGSLLSTNTFLLPGVLTTPTTATAGYASQYLSPAQYTNTGAVTLTGGKCTSIGFNIGDRQRYLSILYTLGGTTNASVSAVLTARRQQFP